MCGGDGGSGQVRQASLGAAQIRDRSRISAGIVCGMSSDETHRPPAPVVAAVVIYALLAAVPLVTGVGIAIAAGEPAWLLFGLIALLPGSVALGLWQGNRGARVGAIMFGFPSIVVSIVMVLLLAAPDSSRAWFTPDELDEYEFLDEDGDDEDDGLATGRR
jgi:hypothetical protein